MQTLEIAWRGETYEFRPEFDLFTRIEEKVAFNRITESVHKTAQGHVADIPMSHVSWVMYCCLRYAGVSVRTPMEVHHALVDGSLDYGKILGELIIAYYGAQPERMPKKKPKVRPRSHH